MFDESDRRVNRAKLLETIEADIVHKAGLTIGDADVFFASVKKWRDTPVTEFINEKLPIIEQIHSDFFEKLNIDISHAEIRLEATYPNPSRHQIAQYQFNFSITQIAFLLRQTPVDQTELTNMVDLLKQVMSGDSEKLR